MKSFLCVLFSKLPFAITIILKYALLYIFLAGDTARITGALVALCLVELVEIGWKQENDDAH